MGKRVLKYLRTYIQDCEVVCFIDQDENKRIFEGLPVFSIDEFNFRKSEEILIVTSQYYDSIKENLLNKGLKENENFFYGEFLYYALEDMEAVDDAQERLEKEGFTCSYINKDTLLKKKMSEKLFIMGSGSSINEYTPDIWNYIKENDSWGFNYFLVHPFIPTYYSFEVPNKGDRTVLSNLIFNYMARDDYPLDYIKDVRYVEKNDFRFFENKKESIPIVKDTSLYFKNRVESINQLKLIEILGGLDEEFFVRGRPGSLISIVLNGIKLGYKEIILCGVDLNNSDNFYNNPNFKIDLEKYRIPINNKIKKGFHITQTPTPDCLGTSEILGIIDEILLKPRGIKLYIASSTSLLSRDFEIYNWDLT
ncbi:hypothetical protein [Lysinibacillus capsici]|uniref:hypothetical protein n=1 Tax=Lysinibacillus capsici TaxID=2115968 RepID=UPI0034E3E883